MMPADRSARMVAALSLFSRSAATAAAADYARELDHPVEPWPDVSAAPETSEPLAESPEALSRGWVDLLFGGASKPTLAQPRMQAAVAASLEGLAVTELSPDAQVAYFAQAADGDAPAASTGPGEAV